VSHTDCAISANRANANTPSNGALVVQQGGKVIWRNIWIAYGMANPSANGHSPVDQVLISLVSVLA
jgi:hypothetical protein